MKNITFIDYNRGEYQRLSEGFHGGPSILENIGLGEKDGYTSSLALYSRLLPDMEFNPKHMVLPMYVVEDALSKKPDLIVADPDGFRLNDIVYNNFLGALSKIQSVPVAVWTNDERSSIADRGIHVVGKTEMREFARFVKSRLDIC